MPPVSTRRWQKELRPSHRTWRWQVVGWLLGCVAMLWWWLFSWLNHARIQEWEKNILAWYGLTRAEASWWQHGDVPLHVGTSISLLLLLDVGRRLFRPRWPIWSALAITTFIALSDECLQGLSESRAWEWHDLASDLIGMAIAQALVFMLQPSRKDLASCA
jgi:hypothetical protein